MVEAELRPTMLVVKIVQDLQGQGSGGCGLSVIGGVVGREEG